MIQVIIELPEMISIKEKRRRVASIKARLHKKFKISVAEVDLQDSRSFTQIGGAYVSNSKQLGEKVMNKVLHFLEDMISCRIHDVQIYSETF